jgi:DNA-binding NarL/FixJ family response regulator
MQRIIPPPKIGIIGDSRAGRQILIDGFRQFAPEFRIVLVASDGKNFIRKLQPDNKPDLVTLDLNFSRYNSLQTAKWLRIYDPEIKVIIFSFALHRITTRPDPAVSNIKGFLARQADAKEIVDSISNILKLSEKAFNSSILHESTNV